MRKVFAQVRNDEPAVLPQSRSVIKNSFRVEAYPHEDKNKRTRSILLITCALGIIELILLTLCGVFVDQFLLNIRCNWTVLSKLS